VLTLTPTPAPAGEGPGTGAVCAGAAARLLGVIERDGLEAAVVEEIGPLGEAAVAATLGHALKAFDALADHGGRAREGAGERAAAEAPRWVDLPLEPADVAAPAIHSGLTSVQVRTGLWRTMRPLIDARHCNRCTWICGSLCPDGVIGIASDGYPVIDYDHCKGCLVCVAVCPPHAIAAVPETQALETSP
jgi:pyruvate ferredoxin oxidoreductase gamma subunit